MKKLIDELIIARDNADSIKEAQAAQLCINIARAHNPWRDVAKDGLPEPDKLLWFLCRDGGVYLGYYLTYVEDGKLRYLWSVHDGAIYREGSEVIVETVFDDDYDVTHYRYIPTNLPELPK